MSEWEAKFEGRACMACGARRHLFVVIACWLFRPHPAYDGVRPPAWRYQPRARCIDTARCKARVDKRRDRSSTRATAIVITEPAAPRAPRGQCRWCGATLTGERASTRNYCYPDREGRDCVKAWNDSRAWDGRVALRKVARRDGVSVLRCADCDVVCERLDDERDAREWTAWEADHDLALEDGGEHTLANLRVRCVGCHHEKTARENRARAARRRAVA